MTIFKTIDAWIVGLKRKEPIMIDFSDAPDAQAAQAVDTAQDAPISADQPAPVTTDTDKLKVLLIAIGHDIEDEWDHLIALAKKAL